MTRVFDPKKNTIFVDMDGVVADFDAFVLENIGRTFKHQDGPQDAEMWNFLSKVDNLYAKLPPTPYAFELWDLVNSFGAKVEFLTAIPRRTTMPDAEPDKRAWITKHFGEHVPVRIGPYSRDKWKHAATADILIDDRSDNIRDWIEKGEGIGIFHEYDAFPVTASVLKRIATEHLR
jgi:hypothetical protein